MQEAKPRIIDTQIVGLPEFPLGGALSQDQLRELVSFAEDVRNYYSWEHGNEEKLTEQLDSCEEGYTPQMGLKILRAIGTVGAHRGIENDPVQLEHVAQEEAGFQVVLASSVLNGYNTALSMPRAYKAVAGAEGFNETLDSLVEQYPESILISIGNLAPVIEPEKLDEKIKSAYEAIQRDKTRHLSPYQLSQDLVRVIGHERLAEDVRKEIKSGDFFGAHVSHDEVKNVAELGLITPDEALTISLDALRNEKYFVGMDSLRGISELGENPPELWKRVEEAALSIINDPEADEKLVSSIAQSFISTYSPSYDEKFATKIIEEIKDKRGAIALVELVTFLVNDESKKELVDEIVSDALQAFRNESEDNKRGEIAEVLIPAIEMIDEDTRREIITCFAQNNPAGYVCSWKLKPSEEKTVQENEFLRENVLIAVKEMTASEAVGRIGSLKDWFEEGDTRLKEAILAKCEDVDNFGFFGNVDVLATLFSQEELQNIFTVALNKSEDTYNLQSTFSTAIKVFGFEEAKNMFVSQIRSKPDLAMGILTNNQMMLGNEELIELIQVVVDGGKLYSLIYQIDHLAHRLPEAELMSLLDTAVIQAPRSLLERLKSIQGVIDEATVSHLIHAVLQQNPALVLSSLKILPEGYIGGSDEIIEFMKGDERTKLAPKYFQRIMKRLPKAEDTTAFLILSKEAERVYMKLNKILSIDENKGVDMLVRIKNGMSKSTERSELESISLAALMAVEGIDPEMVRTINDAKRNTVVAINNRLGSDLDPEKFAELEAKLGSLVPLSMYLLSIANTGKPYHENKEYLREIVTQLDSGNFREWRYGDREALIREAIIPELTQDQYVTWQEIVSVESSDIVADDAASVARRIQGVISRGLLENRTIEKLSNLEDPIATLGEIKADLGDFGKRIGEVHKMKKAGELSEEEAETQVTELQDQMQQLELALSIVRLSKVTPEEVTAGVLFNENGKPTKSTIEGSLNAIVKRYGVEAMEAFGQLATVLENYRDAATTDIGSITVSDADDFQTTFEIGANPVGSCQHYELGQFNIGLPGYFEPSVKIISVKNDKDKLVARAVLRLASDDDNRPVMVLEPTYMSQASDDIESSIKAHAKTKASSMGIELYIEGRGGRKDIELRSQRAPRIYSDVFGGLKEKEYEQPAKARTGLVLVD